MGSVLPSGTAQPDLPPAEVCRAAVILTNHREVRSTKDALYTYSAPDVSPADTCNKMPSKAKSKVHRSPCVTDRHRHTAPRHKQDGRHHRRTQAQSQQDSRDNKQPRRQHAPCMAGSMAWVGGAARQRPTRAVCEHIERAIARLTQSPAAIASSAAAVDYALPLLSRRSSDSEAGRARRTSQTCCPEQVLSAPRPRTAPARSAPASAVQPLTRSPMAMSTGPITCTIIIGHAVGNRQHQCRGTFQGKEGFCQGEANQKIDDWTAARPAAR